MTNSSKKEKTGAGTNRLFAQANRFEAWGHRTVRTTMIVGEKELVLAKGVRGDGIRPSSLWPREPLPERPTRTPAPIPLPNQSEKTRENGHGIPAFLRIGRNTSAWVIPEKWAT
jgi:hypothetical protein